MTGSGNRHRQIMAWSVRGGILVASGALALLGYVVLSDFTGAPDDSDSGETEVPPIASRGASLPGRELESAITLDSGSDERDPPAPASAESSELEPKRWEKVGAVGSRTALAVRLIDSDHKAAIKELHALLKEIPDGEPSGDVHMALAMAYGRKAKLESSNSTVMLTVRHLKEVLRQDPNDVDGLVAMGMADYYLGQNEASVVNLLKASRLASDRADVWSFLGEVYAAKGDTSQSEACFERSRAVDPNYVPGVIER